MTILRTFLFKQLSYDVIFLCQELKIQSIFVKYVIINLITSCKMYFVFLPFRTCMWTGNAFSVHKKKLIQKSDEL